jgi:uncharacterized membrane protein (UPF0127 family)
MVVALALVACSHHDAGGGAQARISTDDGTVTLHVRVADTGRAMAAGLQGVTNLASDAGMAFLFDRPSHASFWMKDTPLPLSIAFWGPGGRIVALLDMSPCRADPCPTYRPRAEYLGALEAHRGFFADHGVRIGDRVVIVR